MKGKMGKKEEKKEERKGKKEKEKREEERKEGSLADLAWPGSVSGGEAHWRSGLEGAAAWAQRKEEDASLVLGEDFGSCRNDVSESEKVLGW